MSYALSAKSVESVRKMTKPQLSKICKAALTQEEYRAVRLLWMDCCTFTDFYTLVLQKGYPVTRVDAYIANKFFERYHNIGGAKHHLEDS